MPTFRNRNSGQVVQVDDDPSHLSDLARWERIEEGLSAPDELTHTPSSDVTSEVGGHTVEPTSTEAVESAEAAVESAEAKVADATVAAEDAQTALQEAHEDAAAQVQELDGELADTLPAADAERSDWVAYALAHGKTEDDVKGVSTKKIAAWFLPAK